MEFSDYPELIPQPLLKNIYAESVSKEARHRLLAMYTAFKDSQGISYISNSKQQVFKFSKDCEAKIERFMSQSKETAKTRTQTFECIISRRSKDYGSYGREIFFQLTVRMSIERGGKFRASELSVFKADYRYTTGVFPTSGWKAVDSASPYEKKVFKALFAWRFELKHELSDFTYGLIGGDFKLKLNKNAFLDASRRTQERGIKIYVKGKYASEKYAISGRFSTFINLLYDENNNIVRAKVYDTDVVDRIFPIELSNEAKKGFIEKLESLAFRIMERKDIGSYASRLNIIQMMADVEWSDEE